MVAGSSVRGGSVTCTVPAGEEAERYLDRWIDSSSLKRSSKLRSQSFAPVDLSALAKSLGPPVTDGGISTGVFVTESNRDVDSSSSCAKWSAVSRALLSCPVLSCAVPPRARI